MEQLIIDKQFYYFSKDKFNYENKNLFSKREKILINEPDNVVHGKFILKDTEFKSFYNDYLSYISINSEEPFYAKLNFEKDIDNSFVIRTNVFEYYNNANKLHIELLNGTMIYDYEFGTVSINSLTKDIEINYFCGNQQISKYNQQYWN